MLLRRVIDHVRTQNWFAIFLDFLIVVVGVFIGIQVSNWNAMRLERSEEAALLERLRGDFARIEIEADRSLTYHQKMVADLATTLEALRSDRLEDHEAQAFASVLVRALSIQTSADHSATFSELLSSGRGNILRDKDLLNQLVAYEEFLDRWDVAQAHIIDLLTDVSGGFLSEFDFSTQAPFFKALLTEAGSLETRSSRVEGVLFSDDADLVSYDFEHMASRPDFENAVDQLFFLHANTSVWRLRIGARVEAIQKQLSETGG